MITEEMARAKLFAGIEPGSTIIPREVVTYGAVEVLKRIKLVNIEMVKRYWM